MNFVVHSLRWPKMHPLKRVQKTRAIIILLNQIGLLRLIGVYFKLTFL